MSKIEWKIEEGKYDVQHVAYIGDVAVGKVCREYVAPQKTDWVVCLYLFKDGDSLECVVGISPIKEDGIAVIESTVRRMAELTKDLE